MIELLKTLVETPGVPGRESYVRSAIEAACRTNNTFDEITIDALGNLICLKKARKTAAYQPRRIMLAAHMDQVGFLVSYIDSSGLLRLHPVGSFDPRTLASQPVWVVTEKGEKLRGTLHPNGPPVHTAPPESLSKAHSITDFHVDLGLEESQVTKKVSKGDMVVFSGALEKVGDLLVGPALDDRIGCWAVLEAMSLLTDCRDDIYAVFTTQEELGSRGAGAAAFGIEPDIGIACDVVVCCDVPGVDAADYITQIGKGVAIQIADSSTISDPNLVGIAERAAKEAGVLCQRSLMLGGGQDGALIQRSRNGTQTIVFGCPVKHMHTSRETAHMGDIQSYPKLLAAFINAVSQLT